MLRALSPCFVQFQDVFYFRGITSELVALITSLDEIDDASCQRHSHNAGAHLRGGRSHRGSPRRPGKAHKESEASEYFHGSYPTQTET